MKKIWSIKVYRHNGMHSTYPILNTQKTIQQYSSSRTAEQTWKRASTTRKSFYRKRKHIFRWHWLSYNFTFKQIKSHRITSNNMHRYFYLNYTTITAAHFRMTKHRSLMVRRFRQYSRNAFLKRNPNEISYSEDYLFFLHLTFSRWHFLNGFRLTFLTIWRLQVTFQLDLVNISCKKNSRAQIVASKRTRIRYDTVAV